MTVLHVDKALYALDRMLTAPQQVLAASLRWYFGYGPRQSGRTFTMAVVAVQEALEHPSSRIEIVDHYPTRSGQGALVGAIHGVIGKLPKEFWDRFEFSDQCAIGRVALVFWPTEEAKKLVNQPPKKPAWLKSKKEE